eukprot:364840-Chlamydomonas_euryale.AAC.12
MESPGVATALLGGSQPERDMHVPMHFLQCSTETEHGAKGLTCLSWHDIRDDMLIAALAWSKFQPNRQWDTAGEPPHVA